jgi:hydrogenase maturation protease
MNPGAGGSREHLNMQNPPGPISVIVAGLGSPHGDDQIGWAVIDRIRPDLPADVLALKLSNGYELLDRMASCERLIVIDALEPLGQPGRVRRFTWPCASLADDTFLSTHGFGPISALRLAECLGELPACVTIIGVEGERFRDMFLITESVARGLEIVADAALREVTRMVGDARPS